MADQLQKKAENPPPETKQKTLFQFSFMTVLEGQIPVHYSSH